MPKPGLKPLEELFRRMGDQVSGRQRVDVAPSGLGCASGDGKPQDRFGVVVVEGSRIEGRFTRRARARMSQVASSAALVPWP